jgi:hypothetical protein
MLGQLSECQNAPQSERPRDAFFWMVEALCAQQSPSDERDAALLQLLMLHTGDLGRWRTVDALAEMCRGASA